MLFNYPRLQAIASGLIKDAGLRITLSRDDTDIARSYGVLVSDGKKNFESPLSALVTVTTAGKATMLIAGDIKVPPQVGDLITSKLGTFHVSTVDVVKPATTAIYFSVTLT